MSFITLMTISRWRRSICIGARERVCGVWNRIRSEMDVYIDGVQDVTEE